MVVEVSTLLAILVLVVSTLYVGYLVLQYKVVVYERLVVYIDLVVFGELYLLVPGVRVNDLFGQLVFYGQLFILCD